MFILDLYSNNNSLVVPNKTIVGDGMSFFEVAKTFFNAGNILMKTIPSTNTLELHLFLRNA